MDPRCARLLTFCLLATPVLLAAGSIAGFIAIIVVAAMTPPRHPSRPDLGVHGATASTFELDGAALRYDSLLLNVSLCNQNPKNTYLVLQVVATASYGGVPLGAAVLVDAAEPVLLANGDGCIPTAPPLRPALFRGKATLRAGSQAAAAFRREEAEGLFTIDVHLRMLKRESSDYGDPAGNGLEFSKWTEDVQWDYYSVELRRSSPSSSSSPSSLLGSRGIGGKLARRRLLHYHS